MTGKSLEFESVLDLSRTSYFKKKSDGTLIFDQQKESPIIDMHTHIGWNFLLSRPVAHDEKPVMKHFFPEKGYDIDLMRHSAHDVTPELRRSIQKETIKTLWTRKGIVGTHTVPNLLSEMDHMGVVRSIVLAVDTFRSKNTLHVLDATSESDRLIPFGSIHPSRIGKEHYFQELVTLGIKGIKIHPPMQMIHPTHKGVYELAELGATKNIPLFFHCGHAPLAIGWQKRFTNIDEYMTLIENNPKTTFILGHAGYDEYETVAHFAKKHENTYVEIGSQPPQVLIKIMTIMGDDRLVFGSDWPFYPTALPLAKVLFATEKLISSRKKILYTNAQRLLQSIHA
jgi:predicted TIM-barrel fold metal-dependent hydrolase